MIRWLTDTQGGYGCPGLTGLRTASMAVIWAVVAIASSARAQVEMIVRVESGTEIERRLESVAKERSAGDEDLFKESLGVRPVLPARGGGKQHGRVIPAYVIQYRDSLALDAALARWSSQPDVRYVQANRLYALDLADSAADPLADSLDHIAVVGAETAWTITEGSSEILVGLVDTGIRFDHPDLEGQFAIRTAEDLNGNGRLDATASNGVDDDGNGYVDDVSGYDFVDRPQTVEPGDYRDADPFADDDGSGHGTNVAGIVAAVRNNGVGITGIAPRVRLVSLRAFGRDGRGDDEDIAKAVIYAAENDISVLNLSFGDTHISPLMHESIRYAVERGVVVVASAGNVGGDKPHYPSDYPEVISVAWLSSDGQGLASRATSGVGVDLGAPGSSIYTTTVPPDNTDSTAESFYGRRSGSSMAAPMVAAAAALVRSIDPALSPASVRSALTSSAHDVGESGWDHATGAGLLQVAEALRRALPARVEITSPLDNSGMSTGPVEVRGTVVDPSFEGYQLYYASGDADLVSSSWNRIGDTRYEQVYAGVLGSWDIGELTEGLYTLRLSASLRTGRTVEERRRVYVDRSPPVIRVYLLDRGLISGYHGVIADVETDDVADVELRLRIGGAAESVSSARRARRHGLYWPDRSLAGGEADVTVLATNRAGLQSEVEASLTVPAYEANTGLLNMSPGVGPAGFLLDRLTDFDGDELREVVLNVYEDGWIGDTLAVLEWDGAAFRRASTLIAGVIPRSTGDSDGDGRSELLTQVGAATLLLEQDTDGFPSNVAFVDTTGLSGNQSDSFWGGGIADLDGDGRGEIIGHNTREWKILEWSGSDYVEVSRLDNPTGVEESELGQNTFEQPYPVVRDFDGDGRPELLVGDSDGDWILYEATGDDSVQPIWTFETSRYDGGSRFGVGDLDGDDLDEFVVYEHNWLTTTGDGEREPDIGRYTVFRSAGDNAFEPVDSFLVSGEISRHGSMSTLDADGDGREDLFIVSPPDLYVFAFEDGLQSKLIYHEGLGAPAPSTGFRSIRMAKGDLDGDGHDELVLADADGSLRVIDRSANTLPSPAWDKAHALDAVSVHLSWKDFGADSVRIYRALPGNSFDPVAVTQEATFIDSVDVRSEYALLGFFGGINGPLSRTAFVRPHAPAVAVWARRLSARRVEMMFTEPLDPRTAAEHFVLDDYGQADGLLPGMNGKSVVLDFKAASETADTLRWNDLVDAEGTPVPDGAIYLPPTETSPGSLFVKAWRVESPGRVMLDFSAPLQPSEARRATNYRIDPVGEVVNAEFSESLPESVMLEIEGVAVGATGLPSTLTVVSMIAADGDRLATEGNTVRLSGTAEDLSDVYVFPNPYRAANHNGGVMIAGLPAGASIEVFSPDGILIRRLNETVGNGGAVWDLTDSVGARVPSGIYLFLVKADGQPSVLKKAAVIQ